MLRVISNIVLWEIIALIVVLSIRSLVKEHQSGSCCECIGDCSRCRIQCHSNTNYYGVQRRTEDRAGKSRSEEEE